MKYHKMFDGLILPPAIAQKVERAVSRLRKVYNTTQKSDAISAPIKKVTKNRIKKLDALLKFKVAGH